MTLAINRNIKYYYYLYITSSGFKITAIAVYKKKTLSARLCVRVFSRCMARTYILFPGVLALDGLCILLYYVSIIIV